MFENRMRIIRNSIAIFLAGSLIFGGIYLTVKLLEWAFLTKPGLDYLILFPSAIAFSMVGAVIGSIAYIEDVSSITWTFVAIIVIFGFIFPIIVFILVNRDKLPNIALLSIALFPLSLGAAYIVVKSSKYFLYNYGHDPKEDQKRLEYLIKTSEDKKPE